MIVQHQVVLQIHYVVQQIVGVMTQIIQIWREQVREADTEFDMNDWQKGVLFYNNNIRQQCTTDSGTSLPDLEWDSDLATYAEEYAQDLAQNHNCGFFLDDPHHEDGHDSYAQKDAGENLGMNWASLLPDRNSNRLSAAKTAVNGWAGEGYSGSPNHYTALNWKSTTKLGCGIGLWNCNNKDKPGGYYDDKTTLKRLNLI